MFDWDKRSTMQKWALVISIISIVVTIICIISASVCTQKAVDETWFVKCTDCKSRGGSKECKKTCCLNCATKDAIIFYALRGFCMLFALLSIAAEFPAFSYFRSLFGIFKYYWGRGLLQMFVGFLTLTGNAAPDDPDAAVMVAALGWIAIGYGCVQIFFSCLCFKEYSEVSKDMADAQARQPQGGAVFGAPQQTAVQRQTDHDMHAVGATGPAKGYAV
jgi:hypothetical protein